MEYNIKLGFSVFWLVILRGLNQLLNFFSLKQTKQFWGIVYDSISKQPLDPVIVKLMYVDGREVETCVTDLAGRYGFLARPGKFKILARKTNYLFPSKYAPGSTDGIYENLYHGEFFTLMDDYEVVAPNIPMDPASADWNQKAKLAVIKRYPLARFLFKRIIAVIFWFGFILNSLYIYKNFPHPMPLLFVIGAVYLLLLVLALYLPEARLWGQVKFEDILEANEYLFLELYDLKFSGISFGKAKVKEDGKFLLRANKGKYRLTLSKININKDTVLLGETPVSIGREGVFSSTIVVK